MPGGFTGEFSAIFHGLFCGNFVKMFFMVVGGVEKHRNRAVFFTNARLVGGLVDTRCVLRLHGVAKRENKSQYGIAF